MENKIDLKKEIVRHIKIYYDEKHSRDLEIISIEINNEEAHDRFGWCEDYGLRQALILCEWEEWPEFVAYLIAAAHLDLDEIFNEMYHEHRKEEEEATEDYYERQQEYREMQGWHP